MALERKPQNLRGYGLAQDPTKESDYTFVADQNRRNAQDKGLGAREAAQKKNFAQRDKESVINLLSKQENIKTNWQPQLKQKITDNQLAIAKNAYNIPISDLIPQLIESNNQVLQYNKAGETIAANALLAAKGDVVTGKNFDALINGDLSDRFSEMSRALSQRCFGQWQSQNISRYCILFN